MTTIFDGLDEWSKGFLWGVFFGFLLGRLLTYLGRMDE